MQVLTFPAPSPLCGAQLAIELGYPNCHVVLVDRTIIVTTDDGVNTSNATAVIAAHTGAMPAAQQAVVNRYADADAGLSGIASYRATAKAMLAGTQTLTLAQLNRVVGALVLYAIRDRSDS